MPLKLLFCFSLLVSTLAGAQTLSGRVTNTSGSAVAGATVSLLAATDSSLAGLQVTDTAGVYSFPVPPAGRFFVTATYVGYATAHSPVFETTEANLNLADLVLQATGQPMKEVVVNSRRSPVQVRGDKMILQVEGSIHAAGNTVLELLRKAPGVSLNQDDRIAMNGKNGVQVFVDGRPLPLSGADLAAYLKTITAAEVEAIELITNPSARYEAEGNAGIINIRLKKNKALGTNGALNAGYQAGALHKYQTGFSFNHRTARINVFGSYQFNNTPAEKAMAARRTLLDSSFAQQGTVEEKSKAHNLRLGTDFFIHPQHTVGVLVNGNFGNSAISNTSYTAISRLGEGAARLLEADNRYTAHRRHLSANLNYLYTGKEGRSLAVNADYGIYDLNGDQWQPNVYYKDSDRTPIHAVTYQMISPSDIGIYSLKADYEQSWAKGKLAVGGKSAYVHTDNDFQRYTIGSGGRELDRDRSNRFAYREAIHAAYLSYHRQWKSLSLQAGLRAENTVMQGTSTGSRWQGGQYTPYDSVIGQNYLDLFPSMALNFSRAPAHQFSLSFSRRIDRPDYQDLNPFELKVDDYLVQKGNAYLRPQYTSGITLAWVHRQKLNTSLGYSRVRNLIVWLSDTTEVSKSVMTKENLANQEVLSFNVSYPFAYKSYSAFVNLNTTWSKFRADFGPGRTIREEAPGLTLYLQQSLKFATTWTAELTGFYNAPSLQEGNMRVRGFWSADAGLQTKLAGDKATLKLAVSDVFNTLQFRVRSSFAGQVLNYTSKMDTRQVKLSLTFRLGSSEVKSARQRNMGAEEEMKRVQ
jgi:iron complex outermembrane receptor protein